MAITFSRRAPAWECISHISLSLYAFPRRPWEREKICRVVYQLQYNLMKPYFIYEIEI